MHIVDVEGTFHIGENRTCVVPVIGDERQAVAAVDKP